jgi:hypothetical protein
MSNIFYPNSINNNFVNSDSNTYAGGFSSNEISRSSLSRFVPESNVAAANASRMTGGRKKNKNKYLYKMSKRKSRRRLQVRSRARGRFRHRTLKGGMGSDWLTGVIGARSGYSVAGQPIPSSLLGLANPVPFRSMSRNI